MRTLSFAHTRVALQRLKKNRDEQNENKRFPPRLFVSRPLYTERERERGRRTERWGKLSLPASQSHYSLHPACHRQRDSLLQLVGCFFPLSGLTSSRPNLFFYRNQRKKKGICSSQQQRIIDVQC